MNPFEQEEVDEQEDKDAGGNSNNPFSATDVGAADNTNVEQPLGNNFLQLRQQPIQPTTLDSTALSVEESNNWTSESLLNNGGPKIDEDVDTMFSSALDDLQHHGVVASNPFGDDDVTAALGNAYNAQSSPTTTTTADFFADEIFEQAPQQPQTETANTISSTGLNEPLSPGVSQKQPTKDDDDDQAEFYVQILCAIPQVFVYSLPPKTSSRAPSAESMKDKQIWSGALKIRTTSELNAVIELVQPDGQLYACCPITKGSIFTESVQAAMDSSRYFSIVVKNDETRRSALLGLGFRDRQESFDFRSSLMDWERKAHQEDGTNSPAFQDLSLGKGEKIQLKIAGLAKGDSDEKHVVREQAEGPLLGVEEVPLEAEKKLAPPPTSARRRQQEEEHREWLLQSQ